MGLLAKRLLTALAATVLGLLLLELGARAVYRVYHARPFDRDEVSGRLLERPGVDTDPTEEEAAAAGKVTSQPTILHPYFGFVANPAWKGVNEYGFLGRAPFATRSPDTLLVGLFGGSVADHMFRAADDVVEDALRESAPFRDKHVVLFDLAVAGYKQPQQLLVLATLLALGAQFDIVINLDGFNEIDAAKDNLQDGVNPVYPYMWKAYAGKLMDSATMVHMGTADVIRARRETIRRWFARWPVPQSAFLLTLWDFIDQHEEAALRTETSALHAALAQSATTPQQTGPAVRYSDDEGMYREWVEVWARASLEMEILCAGYGIRYIHFLQPNQYLAGSKTLSAEERKTAYDPDVADTQRVATAYPMLIERGRDLRTQGVDFVDLTMIFKDESRTVYRDTCCHLNGLGNRQLATAIAAAIVQHAADTARNPDTSAASE